MDVCVDGMDMYGCVCVCVNVNGYMWMCMMCVYVCVCMCVDVLMCWCPVIEVVRELRRCEHCIDDVEAERPVTVES